MNLQEFLAYMDSGERVIAGSEVHRYMGQLSQEALQLTAELNSGYHTPEEIRAIMSKLTGRPSVTPSTTTWTQHTATTISLPPL